MDRQASARKFARYPFVVFIKAALKISCPPSIIAAILALQNVDEKISRFLRSQTQGPKQNQLRDLPVLARQSM